MNSTAFSEGLFLTLVLFVAFVNLWVLFVITIKRWHDCNFSGWWSLTLFVPVIGHFITLIFAGFSRGTNDENCYGASLNNS